MAVLFPFSDYWWLYSIFTLVVLGLLALDLGVFHRDAHEVRFREAAGWCAVWVTLALLFNVGLYMYSLWAFPQDPRLMAIPGFDPGGAAKQAALEFLSGYLVEYSLSVDNIFVFVLVLGYFAVPMKYQHRVLFYGILGALIFRGIFISIGAALMQFHWIIVIFGVFLIFTGVNMALSSGEAVNPEKNFVIRMVRRFFRITTNFHEHHFFVRKEGALWATPLLAALLCLEASDIVFAIDSVPAIFALTKEPFIVFTSNIFAILGLRSLYFMLGGAVEKFHLLRFGLAAVLVFVGLKMVWLDHWYGGKFPITTSLLIISLCLGISIAASLKFPKSDDEEAA